MKNHPLILDLTDSDRARLPKTANTPLLFVANARLGLDKTLFKQLLLAQFPQLKIVKTASNAPLVAGQDLDEAAKTLSKSARNDASNAVFALSVRFGSKNGSDFFIKNP